MVRVPDLLLWYFYWQVTENNSGSFRQMEEYLFKQYYEFIEHWEFRDPGLAKQKHVSVDSYWKHRLFLFKRKSSGTTAVTDAVNEF